VLFKHNSYQLTLFPRQVAHDIGSSSSAHKKTIIDIFAGAGGNAIAFALSGRWETIIAIERDPSVIACAQYNASIYGVVDQITWVNGDSFECLPLLLSSSSDSTLSSIPYVNPAWSTADPQKADVATTVIFASPPWGGPGYSTEKIFDLSTMQPYSLRQIYDVCTGMDCALFLPRTSDLRQIARLVKDDERKIEVVQYCMEGASKALVAYIPAAIQEA
jgi:trimethylguanosine synthase